MRPTLVRPTLARPTLVRPTLARPTLVRPTLARPTLVTLMAVPASVFGDADRRGLEELVYAPGMPVDTPIRSSVHMQLGQH